MRTSFQVVRNILHKRLTLMLMALRTCWGNCALSFVSRYCAAAHHRRFVLLLSQRRVCLRRGGTYFSVHVARYSLNLESKNLFFISTVIRRVLISCPLSLLPRKETSKFHQIRDFIGHQQFWTWCLKNIPAPVENRTQEVMVNRFVPVPVAVRTSDAMVILNVSALVNLNRLISIGYQSKNTTIFVTYKCVPTTCFGPFWLGHHQVGIQNCQRNYITIQYDQQR
jgi:hypothetical protein